MFKNVANQKIAVFAFDSSTSLPKPGDAANITVYVDKDWAGCNVLGDTSATEIESTNAKGWYLFDVTQAETNANALLFTGKSTTSNIVVVGQLIYTVPANFTTQLIDSSGRVDVGAVSGTTQTAGDLYAGTRAIARNDVSSPYGGTFDPTTMSLQAFFGNALTANGIADAMFVRQMTEAYAADGVAPTMAQCLFMIMQMLGEFAISGTTITVKKLDGSTTAFTSALDSSTPPITSRTRT